MRRRIAGLATALAIAVPPAWLACREDPAPLDARPNVLLVIVDTLRADWVGTYGFPLPVTPSIDALAEAGVVFERAIAASSRTAPSHASIMTSTWVRGHTIGFRNGPSRLEHPNTLAELFRRAGYRTAAFVGNIVLASRVGLDAGFELYDDRLPTRERNRPHMFERIAEATTREALDWLEGMDEAPFFLWVHYQDPHGPYTPPSPYETRHPVSAPEDELELPVLELNSGHQGIPAYQFLEGARRLSAYQTRYSGEIAYADRWIGELLAAVDGHPSGRPAIVLFTSDHGESFGENDYYLVHGHATTPELAHVPFVLRAPGIEPGRRDGLVSHVDVLPTLLELAGLPVPADAEGIALGPFLRDERALPDRLVYCDVGGELSAYSGDEFLRAEGTAGAWRGGGGPVAIEPRWEAFRWQGADAWEPGPLDETQLDPVRAYLSVTVPMRGAPPLTPADLERMKALGYVDP